MSLLLLEYFFLRRSAKNRTNTRSPVDHKTKNVGSIVFLLNKVLVTFKLYCNFSR
jgi:hypothetical protein